MFQLVGSRLWDIANGQMYTLISHEKFYLIHLGLLERDLKDWPKYPSILKLFFDSVPKLWISKSFTFDISNQNTSSCCGLNLQQLYKWTNKMIFSTVMPLFSQ